MTLQESTECRLARSIGPIAQAHPGQSGIFALPGGRDAFAARAVLAGLAEQTIDAQYYIWHNDMSGMLLLGALRHAADRGVRVRLLLDDNTTSGMDDILAALAVHPNVQLRLFNPFKFRRWRMLNFLTDFSRLNRRMHNKSFTIDNQATVVGGRNVGDEYFDVGHGVSFADLDVLAVGPIVNDVTLDFERYWNCASAIPAERVLPPASADSISRTWNSVDEISREPNSREYTEAAASDSLVQKLLSGELPLEWAKTQMVSDDPAKGLGHAPDHALLLPRLQQVLGTPQQEIKLVSPYFVPGAVGVEYFADSARRGVETAVLTNALCATDVPAVHAGYAKRRKPLLKAGVRLFELKRDYAGPKVKSRGPGGSSSASLHAKTFSIDHSRVFVGSFNFDPRSARLNTEMGFVIDSPNLAQAIAHELSREIPNRAYELRLSDRGSIEWLDRRDGQETILTQEPLTSACARAQVTVLSWLPIEWLL